MPVIISYTISNSNSKAEHHTTEVLLISITLVLEERKHSKHFDIITLEIKLDGFCAFTSSK